MAITPQQLKQIEARLNRPARSAASVSEPALRIKPTAHQIILGLDPSLRGTGFGVIRLAKPNPQTLVHGTISCPSSWEHSRCFVKIAQTLRDVLKEFQPTVCIVE